MYNTEMIELFYFSIDYHAVYTMVIQDDDGIWDQFHQ